MSDSSLRILHVGNEMSWRGGENQIYLLIEGLQKKGVKCYVAYPKGSRGVERFGKVAPVLVLPSKSPYSLSSIFKIYRFCRDHKIQIYDAQSSAAHTMGLVIKSFLPDLKIVVHRRVDFALKKGLWGKGKYLSPKVDLFIAISGAIFKILEDFGIPKSKLRIARSATTPQIFKALNKNKSQYRWREQYNIPQGITLIGNASALTQQKDHFTFLKALALLKEKGVPFKAFLAGEGPQKEELQQLQKKLGLSEDVIFLGFIQDVPELLSGLDILCVSSEKEGLGTILLDGTHAGCAIAATNVGGIPEIVMHQKTGLLSEVGDAQGLSQNLQLLVQNPDLRKQLVQNAQEHISQNFSVETMVESNLSAYKELLT